MNRSEWMGNKFKNQNVGAYDWVPEIVTSITPAPAYHNGQNIASKNDAQYRKKMASEGLEKSFKHGLLEVKNKK